MKVITITPYDYLIGLQANKKVAKNKHCTIVQACRGNVQLGIHFIPNAVAPEGFVVNYSMSI